MAENTQNPTSTTNLFNKGMVKDYNETFVGEDCGHMPVML